MREVREGMEDKWRNLGKKRGNGRGDKGRKGERRRGRRKERERKKQIINTIKRRKP